MEDQFKVNITYIMIIFYSVKISRVIYGDNSMEGSWCQLSFNKSGYCLPVSQCFHIMEDNIKFIDQDICTQRNNERIVCCPLSKQITDEIGISSRQCRQYNAALKRTNLSGSSLPSSQPSNSMCSWVADSFKNDDNVGILENDYSHVVAIGWTDAIKQQTNWNCAGILLNENFILTAAHCMTAKLRFPDVVRVGAHIYNKQQYSPANHQDINIQKTYIHPKYKSFEHYHDIALLKLIEPVKYTEAVQPACLWQHDDTNIATKFIVTGWIRNKTTDTSRSLPFINVSLKPFNINECRRIYGLERRLPQGLNSNQHICAGLLHNNIHDVCHGNSGGPLHIQLPELKCVKFVVGIISFGKSCSLPYTPSVYTKIFPYLDWIEKIAFHHTNI